MSDFFPAPSSAAEKTSIGRIYFPRGDMASFAAFRTSFSNAAACLTKYDLKEVRNGFKLSAISANGFVLS